MKVKVIKNGRDKEYDKCIGKVYLVVAESSQEFVLDTKNGYTYWDKEDCEVVECR